MAPTKASFSSLAPEIVDEIAFHVANRMPEDWILLTEFSPEEIALPYDNLLSLALVNKKSNASATPELYKHITVSRSRSYYQLRSTLRHLFHTANSRPRLFRSTEIFHLELGSKPMEKDDHLRLLKLMPSLRRVAIFPEVNAVSLLSFLNPSSRVLSIGILSPVNSALRFHGQEQLGSLEELELGITHPRSRRHQLPPPPPVQLQLPPSLTSFKLTTDDGIGSEVRISLLGQYPNLNRVRISGTDLVASKLQPFFDVQGKTIRHLTLLGNDLAIEVRRDRTYDSDDMVADFRDPDTHNSYHRSFQRLLPLVSLCPNLVTLHILDVHLPQVLALSHPTLLGIILEPEDIIPFLRRNLSAYNPCNHPPLRINAISRLVSALELLLWDDDPHDEDSEDEEEEEEGKWRRRFPQLEYLEFNHAVRWSELVEDQETPKNAMLELTEAVICLGIDVLDDWGVLWSEELMEELLEKMKGEEEEGGKTAE